MFFKGRVKRQQSQTQSQDGQSGGQLQSQSQNQPQGQQFQTQSQGPAQGSTTIPAQGSAPTSDNSQYAPQYEHANNQGSAPQEQGGQQPYNAQTDNRNQGPEYQPGHQGQAGQPGYQQGNQFPFANPFGLGAFGPQGFPQFGQPGFPQQGFAPGFAFGKL